MFTCVYGPLTPHRELLWKELFKIRSWVRPWVVGGDFNVIRLVHEKILTSRIMTYEKYA